MKKKQVKLKKTVPDVEVVIVGKGKNTHFTVPFGQSYEIEKVTFTPERENLFLVKRALRKDRYLAVFTEKGEPVQISADNPKVTAETLNIAKNSQTLKTGLSDLFSNPMNTRKIMFFLIIGAVVVAVFFLMQSGGLSL